jgi:hypothetical protein
MSRTPTYTGAPEGIRTLNLLIRSQALYPIELRGRIASFIHQLMHNVKKIKFFFVIATGFSIFG